MRKVAPRCLNDKKPMGQNNARRVLLSSTLARLYAKYLRSDATCPVRSATDSVGRLSQQNHRVWKSFGPPARCLLQTEGVTSAFIFLDLTAAFYRALPEHVLGAPSSCMEARRDYTSRIRAATLDWRAPPWLHKAIADWHSDTSFRVRHTERTYRLVSGGLDFQRARDRFQQGAARVPDR